ncbi:MAG TPA: hypothetical protein VF875_07165 [Anaeromyxobacter sp.]
MRGDRDGPRGTSRRGVLRLLALVPAALAGCATAGAGAGKQGASSGGAPPRAPAAPPTSAATVAAVRSFRVPAETEPAAVFRATPGPGEPR